MTSGETLVDYILMMRTYPPSGDETWSDGFVVRSPEDLPRGGFEGIVRKMAMAARRHRFSRAGRTQMPGWLDWSPMSAHKGERIDVWTLRCVAVLESWLLSTGELPLLPRCPHCTPDAPCDRPRRRKRGRR